MFESVVAKYESENRIYKIISDGGTSMVVTFKDKTLEAYVERYLNELDRLAEQEGEDMLFVRSLLENMKDEERIVRNQTFQGAIWSKDYMVDELVNRWDKTQRLKCHEQEL